MDIGRVYREYKKRHIPCEVQNIPGVPKVTKAQPESAYRYILLAGYLYNSYQVTCTLLVHTEREREREGERERERALASRTSWWHRTLPISTAA